jgi:hypothetical protein
MKKLMLILALVGIVPSSGGADDQCRSTCRAQAATCDKGCQNIDDMVARQACFSGCQSGRNACLSRCK